MKGKKKIDGKKLRRKGKNGEYEVVSLARDMGFDAFRVPLSGASGGIKGDVIIEGKIYGVKRW
jgi:Holliday junction resolvase